MKKAAIFFSIMVILAGIGYLAVSWQRKARVQAVCDQIQASFEANTDRGDYQSGAKRYTNYPAYAAALANLDVSSCPVDFQLAFLDYQQAVLKGSREDLGQTAINSFAVGQGTTSAAQPARPITDNEAATKTALERIAIKYGVIFEAGS
jgi:hypothetical protein